MMSGPWSFMVIADVFACLLPQHCAYTRLNAPKKQHAKIPVFMEVATPMMII